MRTVSVALVAWLAAWPIAPVWAMEADGGPDAESLLGATIFDSRIEPKGAFLNVIATGGAASRAGLSTGDVITGIEHIPVTDAETLVHLLAQRRAGDRIELTVAHLGAPPAPFAVVLGAEAPPAAAAAPRNPNVATARKAAAQASEGVPARRSIPQPAAVAKPAPSPWMLFTDPVEHAFTIEVPTGWRVLGGARRMSQVEVRYAVEAVSPDGAMTLFFGDNSIPAFIVPNPMLATAGFREGSFYSPGSGQQVKVARYRNGEKFASDWGLRRIVQSCSDPKRQASRALPQASRGFEQAYAAAGLRGSIHAGEASFTCSFAGKDAVGYVFAATELEQTSSNANWQVKALSGYIAPVEDSARAAELLSHFSASFQMDGAWLAHSNQTPALAQGVAESGKAMGEAIAEHHRNEQKVSQSIVDVMPAH